jgi:hemoglobin/transferrin/lactoferrin receptor protein
MSLYRRAPRFLPFAILLLALASLGAAGPSGAGEADGKTPPEGAGKDEQAPPTVPGKPKSGDAAREPQEVVVTVTATRAEESVRDVPRAVEVIGARRMLERQQITNFVDAFAETPGVVVQKTSQGQGSPFIRGFTGYRDLVLIDGVRYNKTIFRDGPNQYWALIDPLDVQRVELVKGAGSTLYGSDAIGGTVNVITKGADTWSDKTEVGGEAYYRFSTAERSNIGHIVLKGSHKDKVGFYFGGSFKDYDDFVAGGGTGVVDNSAWQEYGAHAKIEYRPADEHKLTFVGQHFHQTEVPRTEQTVFAKAFEGTTIGSDYRHDITEDRYLAYAKYQGTKLQGPVQDVEVTLSYQRTGEELVRLRPDAGRWGPREDKLHAFYEDTYGAQAQFRSKVAPIGTLTYGADYYREEVDSTRTEYRWGRTNRPRPAAPVLQTHQQGPVADNSSYEMAGVFLQDEKELFEGILKLTASGRFGYLQMEARDVEDPVTGSPFAIAEQWTNGTGAFHFLVRPDLKDGDHWRVFGGVSQAFRAPSLNDFTAFDSSSFLLELPATGLEPERYVNFEIGTRAEYERFTLGATYYYTRIQSIMQRVPTGALDGSGRAIMGKLTNGRGFVNGVELEAEWRFLKDFSLWGNATWTEGELDQYPFAGLDAKQNKPFTRIIPAMSHMGLRYAPKKEHWWIEIHADVYADADRLSVPDQTDTRRIPPGGTSGFGVFGIRGGVKLLQDRFTLTGAVENIANEDYRIHGSGQNMPGTNFILSASYKW